MDKKGAWKQQTNNNAGYTSFYRLPLITKEDELDHFYLLKDNLVLDWITGKKCGAIWKSYGMSHRIGARSQILILYIY